MKPRKRVSKACDQCKRRKAKCDGNLSCGPCEKFKLRCSYGDSSKQLRGPAYVARLEDKIEELQAQLHEYQTSKDGVARPGHVLDPDLAHAIELGAVNHADADDPQHLTSVEPSASDVQSAYVDASRSLPTPDDSICTDTESPDLRPIVHNEPATTWPSNCYTTASSAMTVAESPVDVQSEVSTEATVSWDQMSYWYDQSEDQLPDLNHLHWANDDLPLASLSSSPDFTLFPPGDESDLIPSVDMECRATELSLLQQTTGSHRTESEPANGLEELATVPTACDTGGLPSSERRSSPHLVPPESRPIRPASFRSFKHEDKTIEKVGDDEHQSSIKHSKIVASRERNRLAAAKCRIKKRIDHDQLLQTAKAMESCNRNLKEEVLHLRNERAYLQELALNHEFGRNTSSCCDTINLLRAES